MLANPEAVLEWIRALPAGWRILAILGVALAAHALVQALRVLGQWIVTPGESPRFAGRILARRAPKVATVSGLAVGALTFVIYFLALGFLLRELTPITLGQYLASATVIGLAVGFGTQGLVQDIVTGLTLIFSDAVDVGDLVELSGQTGRVDRIGLRFTLITAFDGKTVYVPNRNIATIGRYRAGYARVFLDVQIPEGVEQEQVAAELRRLSHAFASQHPGVIGGDPRIHTPQRAGEEGWRYVRVRFRTWPGQQALLEGPFRQRVIARMRELDPGYADWMVNLSYRVHAPPMQGREIDRRAGRGPDGAASGRKETGRRA